MANGEKLTLHNLTPPAEKERSVPVGYDSIPHQNWLVGSHDAVKADGTRGGWPEFTWENHIDKFISYKRRLEIEYMERSRLQKEKILEGFYNYFDETFDWLKHGLGDVLVKTEFGKNIEKGAYTHILGEDSSGRIPTLLLNETVRYLSKNYGQPKPDIRFFAGFGNLSMDDDPGKALNREDKKLKWKEEMKKFIKSLGSGRVLVCTELIDSGTSMRNTIEVLIECNIPFDIFAFSNSFIYTDDLSGSPLDILPKDTTMYSADANFPDLMKKNHIMSGVWKHDGDIHANSARVHNVDETSIEKSRKSNASNLAKLIDQEDAMKLSRDLAKYLGANVAQAYLDYKAGMFELPEEKK